VPAGDGLVLAQAVDARGVGIHVALRLGVVQLPADGAEQLAERLDVLLVGFFRVRQEFLDARVHDALGEHLLLEQLADEPDVPQHAPARLLHAVRALHLRAALGQVPLRRSHGRGGRLALLLLRGRRRLAGVRLRLCLRRVQRFLLRRLDGGVALLELLLALGQKHALERDHHGILGVGRRRVLELDTLAQEPVRQRRAHRGVQLGERRLGERLVEELADEPHQRLRLVNALFQDLV
jgi:hypothetical protein